MQSGSIESSYADDVPFYPDDTLEDLQRKGFRMLQKKQGFRLCTDSVLLAAYAASFCRSADKKIRIADLGAGCGAVSLLMAARLPGAFIAGLELNPESCNTMTRNIHLNHLTDRLQAVQGDICKLAAGQMTVPEMRPHSFDLVVSNPPYRRPDQSCHHFSQKQGQESRQQAREETVMTLDDLLLASSRLLKPRGRFILVHRAFRLPAIINAMEKHRLEPKTLRFIQSLPDRAPTTFLMSAVFQGKPGGFLVGSPLLTCRSPGVMSAEAADWYGLEPPMDPAVLHRGLNFLSDAES